ncbi:M42 family metallopeptidase [Amedibacillus dolichus]|uniref:M42 family metallopeptidase n=1 Tax=Amedibacillus dolichus TaxID=31971 RepID=UPI0039A375EF
MNISKETIERITREMINTPSPVSYYEEIHPLLEKTAAEFGYTLTYDRKRTAYLSLTGENPSKTVCVGAHLDTIGLMIRHICSDGTLEVRNLGGINYNNVDGCCVNIHTRENKVYSGLLVCKAHSTHVFDDARSMPREEKNMMVVLDAPVYSAQQVRELGIEHGDIVSIEPNYHFTSSGYIKSRFIDDKAAIGAVFAVLEALQKEHKKPRYNTLFAFPLYEEIGHGGAYLPSEVEEYVALDIGLIGPDHTGSEYKVSICAKDNYTPYDRALTGKLIRLAKEHDINYSVDVFYHYGTDASAAVRAGNNVYATAFGMGCFSSHGMERCHIQAVEETAKLLYAYLTND